MRKTLLLVLLLLSWNLFAAENLKFGVLPSNANSKDSLNIFVKFLSEKTGKNFELVVLDPNDLLPKIASGEVAMADLSSNVYASAMSEYKDKIKYVVTVAARNEKGELVPYYRGIFVALKDSPYNSIRDLKGKSFAFVNKNSTSGYLYPLATMQNEGINPDTFFSSITYAGDHSKIFDGLKNHFLDAGVSNYDSFNKATVQYGNIFKKIGETQEIPSGAIVASATTDPSIIKKVESSLISVKPTDPIVNYPGFLYKGWVKKSGGFYEFLSKLLKNS